MRYGLPASLSLEESNFIAAAMQRSCGNALGGARLKRILPIA